MQHGPEQQFGNYRLERLLGCGSFADVYLGRHIHLDTLAAIKILHLQLSESNREKFHAEARLIAHLAHPSIVRVLDYGVEKQTPFLVMEYASNGTLAQRYRHHTYVPLEHIVSSVRQIATALQFAHERKIVHRDIKPQNMLINEHEAVLLSDFGIALVMHSSRTHSQQALAGTAAYMAPEQIKGHPCPASDQYAFSNAQIWNLTNLSFFLPQGAFLYQEHLFLRHLLGKQGVHLCLVPRNLIGSVRVPT